MSTRPLLSARTAAAISLARRFIGWVAGRLFAYLYVNSAFWAKARSVTPASATTAAVPRRRVRRAMAMVLSWGGVGDVGGYRLSRRRSAGRAHVPAQRGQAHPGGIEPAIDGQHLAIDETGLIAAQKAHGPGHLLNRPVAPQRNGVVVVAAQGNAVHQLGHFGFHRPGGDRVDAHPDIAKLHGVLPGQMDQRGLAGSIGHAQGAGAQAGDRGN